MKPTILFLVYFILDTVSSIKHLKNERKRKIYRRPKVQKVNFTVDDKFGLLLPFQVGTPPQTFNLIVGTEFHWLSLVANSSNKCCNGRYNYSASSSFYMNVNKSVITSINEYKLEGKQAFDNITIAGIELEDPFYFQVILNAAESLGTIEFDGILGLGFNYAEYSNVKSSNAQSILSAMYNENIIPKIMFSIGFYNETSGFITFGGYDKEFVAYNNIAWLEVADYLKGYKWAVKMYSLYDLKLENKNITVMFDSSVEYVEFPEIAREELLNNFGGKDCINMGYFLMCNCSKKEDLKPIIFNLGGYEFTLEPDDYALVEQTKCYVGVKISTDNMIRFGLGFFRLFYLIFDQDHDTIGFMPYEKKNKIKVE